MGIQAQQIYIKSFGEGTYKVSAEKDSDGKSTISGEVGYETKNGTKIQGGGSVDNKGKVTGKVSVEGSF